MGPMQRAWIGTLGVLWVALGAAPARAQVLGPAPEPLQFVVDPLERSPRLAGMGGLIYTVEDEHNQIDLWDFARNPVGLAAGRDSSSIEFWGGTASDARFRDETLQRVRQSLSLRDFHALAEAWRRSRGRFVYGAEVRFLESRRDDPFDDQTYRRGTSGGVAARPTLAGVVKWVESGRMRWALRANVHVVEQDQEYRVMHARPGGDYLGGSGGLLPGTPNLFDANSGFLSGLGLGGVLDYQFGEWLDAAIVGDYIKEKVETKNETKRSLAQYNQDRPFSQGGLSLVGRLGKLVEWGADGRLFRSAAEEDYYITISAGIARVPISARGMRLDADQNGSLLRGRLLVHLPYGLRLGGGGNARYEKLAVVPPAGDPDSYNIFLDHLYVSEPDADSLMLPDSVARTTRKLHAYQLGGGLAWSSGRRVVAGVEYHYGQDRRDSEVLGEGVQGPYLKSWEIRAGAEYRCTEQFTGRAGFGYAKGDANTLTDQDEWVSRTLTLGAGYSPKDSAWGLESGYRVEWTDSDFGDPADSRGSRQNLALSVRWLF